MTDRDETAECRGCGAELRGKPYHMGGSAHHPRTGRRCPSNFYGGFVCSEQCDIKAALELEGTMPGCSVGGYRAAWPMAYQDRGAFRRKWEDAGS